MEVAESAQPIQSEPAWFYVNGARRGGSFMLLYPDRLISVKVRAERWLWIATTAAMVAFIWPSVPYDEWFVAPLLGIILGQMIGRAMDRKHALKAAADGHQGTTVIPLDTVVSLRTDRSNWLGGWTVTETLALTTADGTEYGFRGRTSYMQAEVAGALAGLGREVRATPLGLAVMPHAVSNGA